MSGRPRLLDLFCGAGGAAVGYHRAGFDVVGVDVAPQKNYPFEFHQADAMSTLKRLDLFAGFTDSGEPFDAIHASPPCQFATTMSNRWRGAGGFADERTNLLTGTLELVRESGLPWVVENVAGARPFMPDPTLLHGGMFGLGVNRPRLFSASFLILIPEAAAVTDPIGVYGKAPDGRRLCTRADGTSQRAASSLKQAQAAMGMDWGDWHGVKEAIPPAYTEFIGTQLLAYLAVTA